MSSNTFGGFVYCIVMSYATVQQLKDLGLPADSISELDDVQIEEFLDAAAGVMDAFLASQYETPVRTSSSFLVRINVDLAACDILNWRGYNPEDGDEVYKERCDRWMKTLMEIRDGSLSVPNVEDVNGTVEIGAAKAYTKPRRGWGGTGGGVGII